MLLSCCAGCLTAGVQARPPSSRRPSSVDSDDPFAYNHCRINESVAQSWQNLSDDRTAQDDATSSKKPEMQLAFAGGGDSFHVEILDVSESPSKAVAF